jgi:endonuclease/exonuclease/phosphatase family metal-dependent hydrolase
MRTVLSTCLLLSLVVTAQAANRRDPIVVMTQNQYLGADLTPLGEAVPDPVAVNQAVLAFLAQIQANNFPERARAMAEEMADRHPDVVGLQEVFTFTLNGQNGTPPYRDQLADTLQALEALGEHYEVAASVQNIQLQIPVALDGTLPPDAMVGVTDRDVLLIRKGIPFSPVPYSQFCARPSQDRGPGCNYQVVAEDPATGTKIEQGFVGVDVTIGTRLYRVVNTHLEVRTPDLTNPLSAAIQAAQAAELIGTLQATTPAGRSLIVLGDINSSPEDTPFDQIIPPYFQFISAHFFDAWLLRPGNAPGFTCCQAEDLENHRSELSERIDMIFTNFLPRKVKARLVGHRVADKTRPDRLWPSDHAGVVAEITVD